MSFNSVMATVTGADFDDGVAWYERLFGRPADLRPMDSLAEWHFANAGVVQVTQDSDRGGSALMTLGVDDLETVVTELARRGLMAGKITTGVIARIATVVDPEGNVITLAQLYGGGAR